MDEVILYIKNTGPQKRAELERIRTLVIEAVPDAVESISYGMPAFKYKGKPLLYYGAFKDHMSVFPTSGPTAVLSEKLTQFKVSKGTIQFTLENPLPDSLIKEILDVRMKAILAK